MPVEVAQVLYDLAGALALCRCGARIIGLSDDRYRKNVAWVLNQSWLDTRLRPVFFRRPQEARGHTQVLSRPAAFALISVDSR